MSATASATALAEQVTEAMIAAIEAGAPEWEMPWHQMTTAPINTEGRAYQGINHLWLSLTAAQRGWTSNVWGTYKAWAAVGGQVRKGSKATAVFLFTPVKSKTEVDENGNPKEFMLTKTFSVFAAEQVEGADALVAMRRAIRPTSDTPEAIEMADAWFERLGATVIHGGDRAYYSPLWDDIHLPNIEQFKTAAHYYSTRAHESIHWTGAPSRCNRDLKGKFGDDSYAVEELIAELGAAMWCAEAGLSQATQNDNAGYLAGWLRVLRANPNHLRLIAARAQAAVTFMRSKAGELVPVAA